MKGVPKDKFPSVVAGQIVKIEKNSVMQDINASSKVEIAEVTKLFSRQKFKINAGSDQDISKNDYICVYDKANRKIACGKVYKIKQTSAYVKIISAKQFSRIKNGMNVKLKRGKAYQDIPIGSSSKKYSGKTFRVRLGYAPGIISPYSYSVVELPVGSTFTPNDISIFTPLGGQVNFEYLHSRSISFSLGVRYRSSPTEQILTGNQTVFQENDTSSSAISVLIDSFLYTTKASSFLIRFGTGLNYNMSTVNFVSTEIDEENTTTEEIFSGTSNLSLFALRGLIDARYPMGVFSFGLGVDFEIPLFDFSQSVSVSQDISQEDLDKFTSTLNHSKSSFAVGFVLDAAVDF